MNWANLPKVELHCHLLGVITPALLEQMHREGEPVLVAPEALAAAYPVCDIHSFKRWLEVLKPYQAASAERMLPILRAHADNLIAHNTVYAEIMLSPTMFPREPAALVATFSRWREWAFEFEQGRLQIEFIIVMPRTLPAEQLRSEIAGLVQLHREHLIVGVALVGVETGESIQGFASSLQKLRDAGLGVEIHAGEHNGSESVWDALKYGRPARLGHGLSAFQDPLLIERIHRDNIHLEFCVTSNLRTGAVKQLDLHPIRNAKERGLSFSINTDDPGAFKCSLAEEYERVAESFDFTSEDFERVFRNSMAARFQPRLRYISENSRS
jgi:adenosine deaminase